MKELADNNFKFDENDGKFYKRIENTVGKAEITCYKQFLRFPQCFQRTCTADTQKPGLFWKRVRHQTFDCSKFDQSLTDERCVFEIVRISLPKPILHHSSYTSSGEYMSVHVPGMDVLFVSGQACVANWIA